ESVTLTNVGRLLERRGKEFLGSAYKDPITSFADFQKISVSNPEVYWKTVLDEMNISFSKPPECILRDNPNEDGSSSYPSGQWLPGASINPAQNCLNLNGTRSLSDTVIIWRDELQDDLPLQRMTLEELRQEVCYS
ncbi:putative acyl-activating enzyme 17 peroxisomal protein, partial [Trifolium medium]|nr:putative acyl-activating enzyme 17 peroxisomal protein [Trifolium medium]